jgi:hypothetical protein
MNLLIVSCDAGGAEIISSWVRSNPDNEYTYLLEGPAIPIFSKKVTIIKKIELKDIEAAIHNFDIVMVGTSQSSSLEKKVLAQSIIKSVKCIAYLDYWYGFKDRFMFNGYQVLPDEIWTADKYAFEIARRELPLANVILKTNPYIDDMVKEKNRILSKKDEIIATESNNILYLCQPYNQSYLNESGVRVKLTDIKGVEYFLELLADLNLKDVAIKLRPHPLDDVNKYSMIIHTYSKTMNISLSWNKKLIDDFIWANTAVGMHCQALAVALAIGIKSYYCIPKGAQKCALPHKEIENFARI